jgi:nitrous oxidase accessory protein
MKVLFSIFLLISYHLHLQGANITICDTCEYKSLHEAQDAVNNGDTIFIKKGKYILENIEILKSISIVGLDLPNLHSKTGDEIITVSAPCVSISGIEFTGVTTSYLKERSAIRIKRQNQFEIYNNRIIDCFFGIYLENSKYGLIKNNYIKGDATTEAESGNGIHAWQCEDLEVIGNKVEKQRDGIYFEFVNKSVVKYNHTYRNTRYGLHFMFSNDDEYSYNTFEYNGVGVAVMFSKKIKMIENKFQHNWGGTAYGLLLKEINDAEIKSNIFQENTVGIFVEGSNRVNYINNNFIRNGWAIKFSGGCEQNEITLNNFINNSLDLITSTKLNNNEIHHNYWSKYSGYDLDKDDIGDVPYYPVKLFYYIIDQAPEAIVLMRSLFVDIINFAEKISPRFTPKDIYDNSPLMNMNT